MQPPPRPYSATNPTPIFALLFFNDTATTEIYTLSLHDALPIYGSWGHILGNMLFLWVFGNNVEDADRKSTRLNSSHTVISYAVFCLKKTETSHPGSTDATMSRGATRRRLHTGPQ